MYEKLMEVGRTLVELVFIAAEGSFIQVTVFVGAVLLLFGYIDYKQQGAFIDTIVKARRFQPLIGALLGLMPGCGGSVLIMPLYVKGGVTFGTVIATTIATTGDSAFVTLTKAPMAFLIMAPICLVVGTAAGYLVDYMGMDAWVRRKTASSPKAELDKHHKEAEAMLDEIYSDNPAPCRSCSLKHIGHEEGDEIDMLLHHHKPLDTGKLGYKITHNLYIVFWIILLAGLVLGIVDLTGIDVNDMGGIKNLGYILGFAGTAVTIFFMIASKRLITAQSHEDVEHKLYSLRETFIHNAKETAFVGTWVFGAYLIYEIGAHLAGGDAAIEQLLTSTGIIAVLIGVAVGIIPGCGPQVIFVSLYLKGMFPFTALLANAISQDGDALFPLIAMDRKAAFWTTVVNTVVALVIGVGLFYMGRWLGIEFPNFALASASSS